jgi:hypothetical protein
LVQKAVGARSESAFLYLCRRTRRTTGSTTSQMHASVYLLK